MRPLVADASFICKLYFGEVDSDLAKAFADQEGRRIIAPDLLLVEVGGSVFRRVRDGKMSRAKGDIAMSDLRGRFRRTVSATELMDAAWQMSMSLRHPFSDCVYLALAARKNGLLVTADDKFLAKISQSRWADFAVALREAAAQQPR